MGSHSGERNRVTTAEGVRVIFESVRMLYAAWFGIRAVRQAIRLARQGAQIPESCFTRASRQQGQKSVSRER